MSYAASAGRSGRQPITLVELDLDRCQLSYGTSPCQAGIGATGNTYCYNTRATCQDPANYDPAAHTYRYCTARMRLPVSIDAIPSITACDMAPTKMEVAGGLGARSTAQVTLQDHTHHDRGCDPYWRLRYDTGQPQEAAVLAVDGSGNTLAVDGAGNELLVRPAAVTGPVVAADGTGLAGTYWGRMRARNVHYLGRVMRIKSGYLDLDESDWITRTYLLEAIAGPDSKGKVAIKAKDPLKAADNERAQAPRPGTGSLLAAIDASQTTISITPASAWSEFEASGYLRLGEEVCTYTAGASPTLTIVRGQSGTAQDDHDAGESVQPCLRIAAQTVASILKTLLGDYADVPAEYLDVAGWEAEQDEYLSNVYSTLITEPTSVAKLIKELCQSGPFSIWWDERAALVKIRALRAPASNEVLTDNEHLLQDSVTVTDKPDLRVSQQWVFLSQRDPTESLEKGSNWRQLIVNADLDAESTAEFGVPSISKLYSRWVITRAVGEELAGILVQRFGDLPRELKFSLDAKSGASIWTGDIVRLSTRQVQGIDGSNLVLAVQITQADEAQIGHRVDYTGMAFSPVAYQPPGDTIVISENVADVNLYDLYVERRGSAPTSATVVTFVVEPNVTVSHGGTQLCSMVNGTWPTGALITLENNGRIQGEGGRGGDTFLGSAGVDGTNALQATHPMMVYNYGEIWSGGGGGGAVGSQGTLFGGGGGAGSPAGDGGIGEKFNHGDPGTTTTGGDGARESSEGNSLNAGGGPGQDGERGTQGNTTNYLPGLAGYYIIGNALVTWAVEGDVRGRILE